MWHQEGFRRFRHRHCRHWRISFLFTWDVLTAALGRLAWYDMTWLKWKQSYFDPIDEFLYAICVGIWGEHVCVCVCVQVSTNLESPPIIGNWGVIGHLCLKNFILLKHIKKNGLKPEMGSGIRLCIEKVLDTLRHPLKAITSLLVFLYVCLAWLLV